MKDERSRSLLRSDNPSDVHASPKGRSRDIELITDELMREASPAALSEIQERAAGDPEFRRRRDMLRAVWNALITDERLAISDDRIAEADLWRRIREQEGAKDILQAHASVGSIVIEDEALVLTAQAKLKPEPWYRVLPPSWFVRIAAYLLLAIAGLFAVGWTIHRYITETEQSRAYQTPDR